MGSLDYVEVIAQASVNIAQQLLYEIEKVIQQIIDMDPIIEKQS